MHAGLCNSNDLRATGLYYTTSLCWWLNCFTPPHNPIFIITIKIAKKVSEYDGNPNIPSLKRALTPNDLRVPKATYKYLSYSFSVDT